MAEQLLGAVRADRATRQAWRRSLSRGMRQKVAICCAYLHSAAGDPVDEPLTGLDPRGIRTMKQSLRAGRGSGRRRSSSARTCWRWWRTVHAPADPASRAAFVFRPDRRRACSIRSFRQRHVARRSLLSRHGRRRCERGCERIGATVRFRRPQLRCRNHDHAPITLATARDAARAKIAGCSAAGEPLGRSSSWWSASW